MICSINLKHLPQECVSDIIGAITNLPSEETNKITEIVWNWIWHWPKDLCLAKCNIGLTDTSNYLPNRVSVSMEMRVKNYGKELKFDLSNLGISGETTIKFIN